MHMLKSFSIGKYQFCIFDSKLETKPSRFLDLGFMKRINFGPFKIVKWS
jgi:hypothetical protein